jgi:hypothetical protein
MNVKDLKCYPQVVAVIGEALADYELGRVIDYGGCSVLPNQSDVRKAFCHSKSPQGDKFWWAVSVGVVPYKNRHEKPEVKEWAYIRDTAGSNRDEWHFKYHDEWKDSDGCYYDLDSECIEILATHKSVTMPNWVPELSEITPTNSDKIGACLNEPPKLDLSHYKTVPKSESGDKPVNKYKVLCKGIEIDVYDVLLAYAVTNPADQHAIKKMLMPGKRGVKDANQDRKEAIQSLERAIELASASE